MNASITIAVSEEIKKRIEYLEIEDISIDRDNKYVVKSKLNRVTTTSYIGSTLEKALDACEQCLRELLDQRDSVEIRKKLFFTDKHMEAQVNQLGEDIITALESEDTTEIIIHDRNFTVRMHCGTPDVKSGLPYRSLHQAIISAINAPNI